MPTTIKLRNSVTTTSAPSSLVQGEVAINITDKKVWVGNAATTPIQLLGDGGSASFTSIAFGAGTVSSPSITFTGDTNTGIYSPAADTIAFTEGGVESMRIDSSGNVGIGINSPSYRLHISSTASTAGYFTSSGSVTTIDLDNTNANGWGGNIAIRTGGTAAGYFGTIGSLLGSTAQDLAVYATASNGFRVYTNGNNERMRIDSSGNVGIGTSSPTQLLDVNGNAAITGTGILSLQRPLIPSAVDQGSPQIAFRFYSTGTTYTTGAQINALTAAAWSSTSAPTNLVFYTVPSGSTTLSERMRITSGGDVGIGTSSPLARLDVVSGSASNRNRIRNSTGEESFLMFQNSNTGTSDDGLLVGIGADEIAYVYNYENTALVFGTNSTERMRITSVGELFLGATTSALNSTRFLSFTDLDQSAITARATNANQGNDVLLVRATRNTTTGVFNAITYYNDGAGAYRFIVRDSGNALNTNGSYGTISDAKLKENIVDATPKLDKVNQLKVRNYNLIGDNLKQIGFVAQEFEQVFPSMVEESPDKDAKGNNLGTTTKTIKTTVLIPILVKAMQEQQAIITDLKQRIETLEAK